MHNKGAVPLLFFLILIITSPLVGLQIQGEGGISLFDPGMKKDPGPGDVAQFIGGLDVRGSAGPLEYHGNYMKDPIFANRVTVEIGAKPGDFSILGGVFLPLDPLEDSRLNPGISLRLAYHLPEALYLDASGSLTIGNQLLAVGDYSQIGGELSGGTWIGKLFSLGGLFSYRRSQEMKAGDVAQSGSLTRFALVLNTQSQERNFGAQVALGFQQALWEAQGEGSIRYRGNSIFAAVQGFFRINPHWEISAGFESPIYSWVDQSINTNGLHNFLFMEALVGLKWTLGE